MFDFQFFWNSVMNWMKSLKFSFTYAYSYIKYFVSQVASESLLTLGEVLVNTSWCISELTICLIHFSCLSIVAICASQKISVYSYSDYMQDLKIILLNSKWIVFYLYTTFSYSWKYFLWEYWMLWIIKWLGWEGTFEDHQVSTYLLWTGLPTA